MRKYGIGLVLALVGLAQGAGADSFTTGSLGDRYHARLDFVQSGDDLIVTLTNLSNVVPGSQADLLYGAFWDFKPDATPPTPAVITAITGDGLWSYTAGSWSFSTIDVDLTGHWAFTSTTASAGLGGDANPKVTQHYGIGSAGFGLNLGFSGLDTPMPRYGLASAAVSDLGTGGDIEGKEPHVYNSLSFTFKGWGEYYDDIASVRFQYGTSLAEPSRIITAPPPDETEPGALLPVPEPSTLVLFGVAVSGTAIRRLRRSARARA